MTEQERLAFLEQQAERAYSEMYEAHSRPGLSYTNEQGIRSFEAPDSACTGRIDASTRILDVFDVPGRRDESLRLPTQLAEADDITCGLAGSRRRTDRTAAGSWRAGIDIFGNREFMKSTGAMTGIFRIAHRLPRRSTHAASGRHVYENRSQPRREGLANVALE